MADTADVDIESVGLSGDGLAQLGRRQLAVPFTIPGERVRVRLGARRGAVTSAFLIEVLRASPNRVRPACRHFGPEAEGGRTCGGCSWQHIAYPAQLTLKTDLVTRLVHERIPAAPPARPMLAATRHDAPWTIETKSISSWTVDAPVRSSIGHYARFSRHVVAVRECPVHDDRGNAVAFALRDACQWADTHEVKSIAVRAAARGLKQWRRSSSRPKTTRESGRHRDERLLETLRRRRCTSTSTHAATPSSSVETRVT